MTRKMFFCIVVVFACLLIGTVASAQANDEVRVNAVFTYNNEFFPLRNVEVALYRDWGTSNQQQLRIMRSSAAGLGFMISLAEQNRLSLSFISVVQGDPYFPVENVIHLRNFTINPYGYIPVYWAFTSGTPEPTPAPTPIPTPRPTPPPRPPAEVTENTTVRVYQNRTNGPLIVYVDGYDLSTEGFIQDGRSMVPLRAFSQVMQRVTIYHPDGDIHLFIGGTIALIPSRQVSQYLDTAPVNVDGTVFVPIRFVLESFRVPENNFSFIRG